MLVFVSGIVVGIWLGAAITGVAFYRYGRKYLSRACQHCQDQDDDGMLL
jgi:hypothetical protein